MRDQLIIILRHARNAMGRDPEVTLNLLVDIETEAMAALQCDKTIIPSKLFGEIPIPQDVITAMSNGDSDTWFSYSMQLDVNVFYVSDGWQFNIYPVKNGEINTDTELEHGKL
jgi:hypothetical protein